MKTILPVVVSESAACGDVDGWPSLTSGRSAGLPTRSTQTRLEIDDHEQFGLEIVAPHCGSEIDLALDNAPGDRRADVLPAQRGLRLVGSVAISLSGRPSASSFCRAMSKRMRGLRGGVARSQILLLGRWLCRPTAILSRLAQVLLQIVRQARRR